ncbi:MAG: class I SAM-dependent methyltransferase [Armatimonadetes bacterium]|nr:class I SAM-dependent methyltransferase [Armatimonadota bacterium]MDW8122947.1 class I SAM-dependent methyltransferase [Armatimonadota bacterium]
MEGWGDLERIFRLGYHFKGDARSAAQEVEFARRLLALPTGSRVLMPFCGAGFYAIELALWGYEVVGMDPCPSLVEAATQKAEEEGVSASFLTYPNGPLSLDRASFDGFMVIGNRFGLTGNEDGDERFVGALKDYLKPDSHLVFALPHRDGLVSRWLPKDWEETWDQAIVLIQREWDATTSYSKERWTRIRTDNLREQFRLSFRVYSATEFSSLLSRVGLQVTKVLGGTSGAALSSEHLEMLIQAIWSQNS